MVQELDVHFPEEILEGEALGAQGSSNGGPGQAMHSPLNSNTCRGRGLIGLGC